MTVDFVHLHNHSHYSLLDGMSTAKEIIEIVEKHGQSAVALTDHGTMGGVLELQEEAKKSNVKPILGIEAYFVPSIDDDRGDEKKERFHLILHAKNDVGLQKLFKVNKKAWQRPNFYRKPRIDFSDLEYLFPDVVCLSGCMGGYLSQAILDGQEDTLQIAERFVSIFKNDFYVEIQPWNEKRLNDELIRISKALNIGVVPTLDCHYPTKRDRGVEETLLMMAQMPGLNAAAERHMKANAEKARLESDLVEKMNCLFPDRFLRFEDIGVYLQSTDEVVKSFADVAGVGTEIFDNTMIIADKCSAGIEIQRNLLPKFSKVLDSGSYLRELAEFGLYEKGFANNQEYVDRLNYELDTVIELGFADYFLIVWDIVGWAKREGIPVGPGRGSVGGSLLALCLDITKVDPIKYGLLFSRFLNKERVSWPDIDMDFGDKRREEVKEYMKQRWGVDNVASIATYTEFKPKGLIKDIARVFGVPYQQANALSPLFETLDELKANETGRAFLSAYPETLTVAERLEGRIKGTGIHAAGVVVSSEPLWKVCPVESRNDKTDSGRAEVVALDMNQAELLGLLKFDILGIKSLTVVDDCLQKIKEKYSLDVADESLGLDDPAVYELLSSGFNSGVFQAEASAMSNLLVEMGVSSFTDLSAASALVRPGAFLTQGEQFVAVKSGKREAKYAHEILRESLEETYGTVIYQEQLMKLAENLAGFSQYEADVLRKIIGKKRDAIEFEPFKEKFIEGSQKYVTKKVAEKLWEDLETSSTYMFNKSHSVAYSMLSYQTAWLKCHYPLEFMWALLANEDRDENLTSYLIEANRLGVQIDGPDVNISEESFTLDGNRIRFGLRNVANCGPAGLKEILEKRPFRSVEEMRERCRKTAVKATLMENFEKLNAFQSMGVTTPYDSKKYWLKLLNCPIFADEDKFLEGTVKKIADVDLQSKEIHVVRAIVKSTKRKPNYFRVELEDTSGSASVFGSLDMSIKTKDYLLALVGDRTLFYHTDATLAEDNFDDPFVQFLRDMDKPFIIPKDLIDCQIGGEGDSPSLVRIIGTRIFKTKANKIMANIWVYYPVEKSFRKLVAFSTVYGKNTRRFIPWSWVIIKTSDIKGGGEAIDDVIGVEEFCNLKNIDFANIDL